MPEPSAANAPKWWVHFVGVRARTTKPSSVVPMRRWDGPSAAPRMRSRRSSTTRHTARPRISSSTGARRSSEPSAETENSDSYRTTSWYQV